MTGQQEATVQESVSQADPSSASGPSREGQTPVRPWLTIAGIGDDGWDGLPRRSQQAILDAGIVFAGQRHLDLLPPAETVQHAGTVQQAGPQQRRPWPSPFSRAIEQLLELRGQPVCVVASGDPMLYGIGATLSRQLPAGEMRVLPSPSSLSLAAACMGWPLQEVAVVSVHGRPVELLHPHLHPAARLLVLSEDGATPLKLAGLLCRRGFAASSITVLEHLGGPQEQRRDMLALDLAGNSGLNSAEAGSAGLDSSGGERPATVPQFADLNIVAITCRATAGSLPDRLSTLAGLPDSAFRHDGQLTKRDVRAVTLAHLAPSPGELLWDVGGGCGSIGIEWMRAHPSCRAIAVEAHEGRQEMIRYNAAALGVPGLRLVCGKAPAALQDLPSPDAIFIGGGVTAEGMIDRCWQALRPGGRLVANAVTLESELEVTRARQRLGGDLTRLSVAHAGPLGRFEVWRTAMPITLWMVVKG